jgi:cell wall-associated NlpC family hydrolase/GH24 family phage-related lysozyme (muramidase)
MHVSENGLQLIKNCEGFCGTAYKLKGEHNYTIGYGHAASSVKAGDTVTKEQATELLKKDVQWAEECVRKGMVGKPWIPNQNQFNAMTYYCYGRGSGACKELFNKCTTEQEFSDGLVKYWGTATRYKKGLLRGKVKLQALFNSKDLTFVPGSEYNVVADKIYAGDTTASYKDVTPSASSYITLSDGSATTIDDSAVPLASGDSDSSSSSSGGFLDNIFRSAVAKYLTPLYGSEYANSILNGSTSSTTSTDTTSDTESSGNTTISSDGDVSDSTTIGQDVATDAANYIGGKYVWGGTTLGKGVDCSGFVYALYNKHGYKLPRTTASDMFKSTKYGKTITGGTYEDLKPGDAMFFKNSSGRIHHVGIYAGNDMMIHAQSKNTGIVKTDLSKSTSYPKEYCGAKRYGSGSGLVGSGSGIDPRRVVSASRLFGGESDIDAASDDAMDTSALDALVGTDTTTSDSSSSTSTTSRTANAKATRPSINVSSSSVDLSSITDAINKLLEVLNTIADNTSTIATICDLIKGITGKKDEDDNSSNTTKPSASTSSSSNNSNAESNETNIKNIVEILTALARA